MKKFISVVLLLAMCVACFVGCAPEAKENAALDAAKEYLYSMYKDAEEKTAVDYTVVSQVRIGDVTYPITWTTDVSEDKVKITAGEDSMTVVDINEATAEQIDYNLIATLKDADGNEVSVSFKHFVPKADGLPATLADGTYVILNGNLTMSSLASDKTYGYPTATEVTVADGTVSGHKAADVLTIKNVDGGFTIQDASGRYFYLKGTYNSFNVDANAPSEGHIFSIVVKDGKYLIQNNLDKKTLAYSTSYSSWGCYAELTDDHASLVDIIAATAPTDTPDDNKTDNNTGNTDNNGNSNNTSDNGNSGNTNTSVTDSKVVFNYSKETKYVTGKHYLYTNSTTGSKKYELELSDKKSDALVMEKITNTDGTVSFKAGGQYLFCDGTDVKFVSSQSDNTKFVLENATGGYYIKCYKATYNNNAQYLEVYNGYLTCYSKLDTSDATIYVFKLDGTDGANGSISAQDGSNASSSSSSSSGSSSSSSSSSTDSGSSSKPVGTSVTFDFSSLDKKGEEITSGAYELFDGTASAGGLTAVTLTKVYNGNATGGQYANTAGLLKLGTSSIKGQIEMTFSRKVAKVEILSHGWKAGTDYVSVNGSAEQQLANNGTNSTLTFALDGSSETVTIDVNQRAFIFKIVVTFAN